MKPGRHKTVRSATCHISPPFVGWGVLSRRRALRCNAEATRAARNWSVVGSLYYSYAYQGAFAKTNSRPLQVGRWINGKPTAKKNRGFYYVARRKWAAYNRATARAPRATTTATATAVAIDLRFDFSQAKMETRDFGHSKNGGRIRRTNGVFCGVWRATKAPQDGPPGCVHRSHRAG